VDIGQELVQWLVNQGVAVAIAVYVLVRLDIRMGQLLVAIQALTDSVNKAPR